MSQAHGSQPHGSQPHDDALADVRVELDRVVDRLTSIAVDRLPPMIDICHRAAVTIVDVTHALDPSTPTGTVLPKVGPSGLGWQLRAVGEDYLDAARASREPHAETVRNALVDVRHALP